MAGVTDDDPKPTQAEVDAVARKLLATVPTPPKQQRLFVNGESYDVTDLRILADEQVPPMLSEELIRTAAWTFGDYIAAALGCTCPKMADGHPRGFDLRCPIPVHRQLAAMDDRNG